MINETETYLSSFHFITTLSSPQPFPLEHPHVLLQNSFWSRWWFYNYRQSWSVLSNNKSLMDARGAASYQLLVPYLREFEKLNPGSLAIHECDAENHLTRVFVCPSTMLHSLRFVRPVLSLDAAHMKTTGGGGTLYIASVTSACNDIFPVAIALTVDNENKGRWMGLVLEEYQGLHSAPGCSAPKGGGGVQLVHVHIGSAERFN